MKEGRAVSPPGSWWSAIRCRRRGRRHGQGGRGDPARKGCRSPYGARARRRSGDRGAGEHPARHGLGISKEMLTRLEAVDAHWHRNGPREARVGPRPHGAQAGCDLLPVSYVVDAVVSGDKVVSRGRARAIAKSSSASASWTVPATPIWRSSPGDAGGPARGRQASGVFALNHSGRRN